MRNIFKIFGIITLFSMLLSCETRTYDEISEPTLLPITVRYTQDVKPVIDNNCVSCHSPNGLAANHLLTDYVQTKAAIDKILDRIQRPAGDPLKMPQGGSLSQANIDILKKWKTDGLQP